MGEILLRGTQQLGELDAAVTTASSPSDSPSSSERPSPSSSTSFSPSNAASLTEQPPLAAVSSICPNNATPERPNPAVAKRRLIAVGLGTGIPLAVALLVAAVMSLRVKRQSRLLSEEKNKLVAEVEKNRRELDQYKAWMANHKLGVHEISAMPEPATPAELGSQPLGRAG